MFNVGVKILNLRMQFLRIELEIFELNLSRMFLDIPSIFGNRICWNLKWKSVLLIVFCRNFSLSIFHFNRRTWQVNPAFGIEVLPDGFAYEKQTKFEESSIHCNNLVFRLEIVFWRCIFCMANFFTASTADCTIRYKIPNFALLPWL